DGNPVNSTRNVCVLLVPPKVLTVTVRSPNVAAVAIVTVIVMAVSAAFDTTLPTTISADGLKLIVLALLARKPDPPRVTVNGFAPAAPADGVMLVSAGAGTATVNVRAVTLVPPAVFTT